VRSDPEQLGLNALVRHTQCKEVLVVGVLNVLESLRRPKVKTSGIEGDPRFLCPEPGTRPVALARRPHPPGTTFGASGSVKADIVCG